MSPSKKQETISFLYRYFCHFYKKVPLNKPMRVNNEGTSIKKIQPLEEDELKILKITHKGMTFILKDYILKNRFTITMNGEILVEIQYVGHLFDGETRFLNEDWALQINTLEDSIPIIHSSFG